MAGLNYADGVAVSVLRGDGGVASAELGDADDIVASELKRVGGVAVALLADDCPV